MNIVICASCRFNEYTNQFAKYLENRGNDVTKPIDVPYPQSRGFIEQCANKDFYMEKIDEAEIVFVFNAHGYIGISTAMEIMYALIKEKPVRLLFEPTEIEFFAMSKSKKYDLEINNLLLYKGAFTKDMIEFLSK